MTTRITKMTRRDFVRHGLSLGAGLVLAVETGPVQGRSRSFVPNAFLRLDEDGTVTAILGSSELGQGAHTALPLILADELDADWNLVRVQDAPADPAYMNPRTGMQMTGGSSAVAGFWMPLRHAGATARAMLIQAAATRWAVAPESCRTDRGTVIHDATRRQFSYGELAASAAELEPPADVPLKDPRSFRLIGHDVRRIDGPAKVNGTARFGIDVALPGMLTAVIARPPALGDTVKSFDDSRTRLLPGVRAVVQVDAGVAVVADNFWHALKGREALAVTWNEGPLRHFSSDEHAARYRELVQSPGEVVRAVGDADAAMSGAGRTLQALYECPYLSVSPMEPLNCAADVSANRCRVWVGTQFQQLDRAAAAHAAGFPLHQVEINTMLAGGGFGRRGVPDGHFVREAVQISKAVRNPVKVVWTREDDIRGGYYRPASCHLLTARLGAAGKPLAWVHRLACQPILLGTPFAEATGPDGSTFQGSGIAFYGIPNIRTELHTVMSGPKCWAFRSVGSTHNAFVTESFIDELAHAVGQDPVAYRLSMLDAQPRYKAVVALAASKAKWGRKLPAGQGLGIAVHCYDSYVAQVAEVSVARDGAIRVHRVVCAIDCGLAVDPRNVRAQMEGGILMGLSAALWGRITLEQGRVQQSNFHDYRLLRIHEAPDIEVHIAPGGGDTPLGVGEAGLPPIAPAVANAVAAATGKRVRTLPFTSNV
jgi:isoquinoline 1-oxidoreductase subunit beta